MRETREIVTETGQTMAERQSSAQVVTPQVVTQIAPVGAMGQTQIPFGNDKKGNDKKLTLAEVRARLDGKTGKRFWKDMDELAETPGFHEMLAEEFPRQ